MFTVVPPPDLLKIPVWEAIQCHLAIFNRGGCAHLASCRQGCGRGIPLLPLTSGLAICKVQAQRTPGDGLTGEGRAAGSPGSRGIPPAACASARAPRPPACPVQLETRNAGAPVAWAGWCSRSWCHGAAAAKRGFQLPVLQPPGVAGQCREARPPLPSPPARPERAHSQLPAGWSGPQWPFAAAAGRGRPTWGELRRGWWRRWARGPRAASGPSRSLRGGDAGRSEGLEVQQPHRHGAGALPGR